MTYLRTSIFVGIGMCALWYGVHLVPVAYGTGELPLHQSYVGDEQSPVNGALHVLAERNLAAFRNLRTLYYGPVFAMIAVPAVGADFVEKYLTGHVRTPDEYRNYILWDWGGIVWKGRMMSVGVGFLGLIALYMILMTETVNPRKDRRIAYVGTALLATNFYYFEYTSFIKHWIYILTGMLWQVYVTIRMHEDPAHLRRYLAYHTGLFALTFGISYVSAFSQILLAPAAVAALIKRDWKYIRSLCVYGLVLLVIAVGVIAWHPHAFFRLLGLSTGDILNANTSTFSNEIPPVGFSFTYYAQIAVLNHLALIILWILGVWAIVRKRVGSWYVWSAPIVFLTVWFLIFGSMGHHESRYILPVIVMLIVSSAMIWARVWGESSSTLRAAAATFIGFTLVFHCVTIVQWERLLMQGPPERAAIADAVRYQKAHPAAQQLFIEYYLLGYPHTREAYQDYMERFGKAETNLYHVLLATPVPQDITPLNVRYIRPDRIQSLGTMEPYDRAVYLYQPAIEQGIEPDFLEVDLTRTWIANQWHNRYTVLKE